MKAKKPIRRSQLISPWGVGQMINFRGDESLMVAGLDMWEDKFRSIAEPDEFVIKEERLAKRLGVKDFRLPPDYRAPDFGVTNPSIQIPFVRFPRWHYCTRCGLMEKISIYHSRKPICLGYAFRSGRSCADIPKNKRRRLIPVRFIAICPEGHIRDFPFIEWVHGEFPEEGNHKLRLRAGRSTGALSGIEVSCICGVKKTMAGAFNDKVLSNKFGIICTGDRPWLGEEAERENTQHCGQHLIVVQKGASNVYFPQIRSSIYLPPWDNIGEKRIVSVLEKNWDFLTSNIEDGNFQVSKFELIAEQNFSKDKQKYYTKKLLEVAKQRMKGIINQTSDDSEEKYRKMEYDAILSETFGKSEEFYVSKIQSDKYYDSEKSNIIRKSFNNIVLLHKLRETRAFLGFSRWLPDDGKTIEEMKNFIKLGRSINWLPAVVVKGEGVFFEFNEERLKIWNKIQEVINRAKLISLNYNALRKKREQVVRNINPLFILLHTFSHLVINQFSFECGYGSSSLRERIYCNVDSASDSMRGILIYTASGDSEGSLGGLVRQGKPGNLESIVYNAIENARWCSSDPICIESNGQGPNSCNLAACHNCALLPETCCEESNMLLDRGLLIGTLEHPEMGYFNF